MNRKNLITIVISIILVTFITVELAFGQTGIAVVNSNIPRQSVVAASPDIFTGISINPYVVPANTASTIHIEANHYGRTIMNIPCAYDFYVVDYETGQAVPMLEGFNQREIILPSNAGRLNADFYVKLPAGHYSIRYIYKHTLGTDGPFFFLDFWVGEKPTEQTAVIDRFTIKETWQTTSGGGTNRYYSDAYGTVDNETHTISVNMAHWHKNIQNAEATVKLYGEGVFTVGDVTYNSEDKFTADFTQPVVVTVTSEDGSVTAEYIVTVTNGTDGSYAELSNIFFSYTDIKSGDQSAWAIFDEESSEYILELPSKLSNIMSEYGFSGVIYSSFGASVTIDEQPCYDFVWWVVGSQGSYQGRFYYLTPSDTYTITVTSADGTATNEYTIRVIGKVDPPIWYDEHCCLGFYYRDSPWENIEDVIPISRLKDVSLHMNMGFLEGMIIEDSNLFLRMEDGYESYPIGQYPHDLPWVPQNEIWFPIMDDWITTGRHEVVLQLTSTLPEGLLWSEYVLGGITLTDEISTKNRNPKESKIGEITVYNLQGVIIYQSKGNETLHETIKGLINGIYIVRIRTENNIISKKVIVNQ